MGLTLDDVGASVQTVNARDLHSFLEVGKDFSTWIKDRISAYSFTENVDFVCSPILGSEGRGGSNRKDYHLSLDMAKELAKAIGIFSGASIATMSSREIAELIEKRHDNVKRTIETLVESKIIVRPQFEDEQSSDAMGRPRIMRDIREMFDGLKIEPVDFVGAYRDLKGLAALTPVLGAAIKIALGVLSRVSIFRSAKP